jgi:hypothetical protein
VVADRRSIAETEEVQLHQGVVLDLEEQADAYITNWVGRSVERSQYYVSKYKSDVWRQRTVHMPSGSLDCMTWRGIYRRCSNDTYLWLNSRPPGGNRFKVERWTDSPHDAYDGYDDD